MIQYWMFLVTTVDHQFAQCFTISSFQLNPLQEEEALSASRLSQTLKDYNYYIGHAYVALARLNVNMLADPPRTLRLNAPRRTEMRHIMSQLRSMPPQRPSGYIIDIKRDGEEGQEGQGQTTRATISREGGPFGGAGPFGAGGLFGGPRPGGPGGGPSLFGGLGGFSIPFSGGADEDEGKKETEQKQESSKQSSAASSSVQQPTEKKDEAMEIGEEVKEKPRPMETEVQASTLKPTASEGEGTKKEDDETTRKEGEDEEGEGDGETPQYLARLLSELITGMVKGPEEGSVCMAICLSVCCLCLMPQSGQLIASDPLFRYHISF